MLAGDPGTVNQCLCVNHENPKLMLEALELDLDSKELMGKLVCSIDNVDCCISDCAECPEDDALYEYLMENIPDEQVTYSEWVSIPEEGTQLVKTTQHITEFIPKLIGHLKKLVTHRFINKSQNEYSKKLKNELREKECILLMDFAENYSSVTQNEIQAGHFWKKQPTLHPFVILLQK